MTVLIYMTPLDIPFILQQSENTPMSDLRTIDMSDSLRELTYLQLCVVPSFIEPYLSHLSPQELKSTFFMFMQTFFEVNSESVRANNCGDSFSLLKEYSRKPIGQQMIHLLKTTLAYYIKQDYPLHTFFLEFDRNTEPNMIHLQKALLNDLKVDGEFQAAISLILLSFDLSLEIYEIKRGNAKFLLNFSGKSQNFELQMQTESLRRKRYTEVINIAESLKSSEGLTQNLKDLCTYCCELANKYEFVVFSKIDRQPRKEIQKIEICIGQIDEEPQNLERYMEVHDGKYWYLSSEDDSVEMLNSSYANLLRNFNEESLGSIERLKNCALALINRLTSARAQSEMNNRTSVYALIAALQLLSGIKQRGSDKIKLAEKSQQLFKQVMQFQICSIETTFYFLIAFLQLNIEEESIYNRAISLIGWVMSQYRKYNFKSQELIYADFIASSLDLLVSWKQSSKQEQEDKLVQTVLTRLANKTKAHGQHSFGLFFETLNTKLLNYVMVCLLKARSLSPAKNENGEQFGVLLCNFQEQINKCITFLTVPQLDERSKDLQSAESSLLYVYLIALLKKIKTEKEEQIIGMRLYHLLRTINQPNKVDFKKETVGLLVRSCLKVFLDRFIDCLNIMLLEYNVTSAKKKQTNNGSLALNAQANGANAFIEQSFSALIFLNLSMFVMNPLQYKDYLVFSLVLDSHCLEESNTEAIIQLHQKVIKLNKIKWQGDETQILKYSRKYDTLQLFFEEILQKTEDNQADRSDKLLSYQKFCRDWCADQSNYQWLSDQKTSRIRLLTLKTLCTRAHDQII